MENLKIRSEGDALMLALSGNIDSNNAPALDREVMEALSAQQYQSATVDCEELNYISSAGLRVILRLKKAVADTKIINTSPEVYDILDITGFTEMLEVVKAYRVISVEGCEVIGEGANGKVYRIDPETIVKAYRSAEALPEIQRERELARTAFVLGVPTAIPYDVVRIEGGGYGSVFELLNSSSLAKLLATGEITVAEAAERSVELLRIIHGTVVKSDAVPDMKQIALGWANDLEGQLDAALLEKLRALIEAVPDDNHMMHGDYHVKNIMLQDGETLLIDMDTICRGNPIFELGSIYNAYVGYLEADHSVAQSFLGIPYEAAAEIWDRTLRLYLNTEDPERLREVAEKSTIVGSTRILRRMLKLQRQGKGDHGQEIANCRGHLAELLPKTETLCF